MSHFVLTSRRPKGGGKRREEKRREGETIDSIGGDRSQEDRAVATLARQAGAQAGREEVFEIGHLTAFSSWMMLPSLSTAAAPPSSPSSSSSTFFFISFALPPLTYVPICSSIIYPAGKRVGRAWRRINACERTAPFLGICK